MPKNHFLLLKKLKNTKSAQLCQTLVYNRTKKLTLRKLWKWFIIHLVILKYNSATIFGPVGPKIKWEMQWVKKKSNRNWPSLKRGRSRFQVQGERGQVRRPVCQVRPPQHHPRLQRRLLDLRPAVLLFWQSHQGEIMRERSVVGAGRLR